MSELAKLTYAESVRLLQELLSNYSADLQSTGMMAYTSPGSFFRWVKRLSGLADKVQALKTRFSPVVVDGLMRLVNEPDGASILIPAFTEALLGSKAPQNELQSYSFGIYLRWKDGNIAAVKATAFADIAPSEMNTATVVGQIHHQSSLVAGIVQTRGLDSLHDAHATLTSVLDDDVLQGLHNLVTSSTYSEEMKRRMSLALQLLNDVVPSHAPANVTVMSGTAKEKTPE